MPKSPPHRAILHHPNLGMLPRIDSFPDRKGRNLFEQLIGEFELHCIHLDGGRYLIEFWSTTILWFMWRGERGHDRQADIEAQYAKSGSDGSFDLLQAAYEEIRNQDQHALRRKGSMERTAKTMTKEMMSFRVDNIFSRPSHAYPFWLDAAVVAGQFATPENVNAFNHAVTAFESALLNGAGHAHGQVEFHRQLLAMASPTAVANFEQFWPHCRVQLNPGFDLEVVLKILGRIRATIQGWRGENPYGADTPAAAIGEYLWRCAC